MNESVDRCCRRHRVFEDLFPLAKRKVAGEHDASAFVPFRQQRKEHFHLLPTLLHVS